ncbi:disulfide bond formation protein B [Acuticoccus sp. MNP-M23]|uniref:disulfide bond formation protein B n=1 Tax=Acuticoccus sp. MNP-M23 TaxID=3072793 RepID=UPI0028152638|nr:disulfide bond formation protein B [Acuticoccus sp. MNP-M23]WMS41007.1 disulfide bond formation protein B [Acuticoccus sp. MNP-M23]
MTPTLARQLNALGLIAISLVLVAAFADQFLGGDLPCPLCILQRAGFALAGAGLALNLICGVRPGHYGLVIVGAVTGAAIAGRQILLHIVPGSGGYGPPILGLHLYTWAFIIFAIVVVVTALLLLSAKQFDALSRPRGGLLPRLALALFVLVVVGNGVSTLAECAGGLCPDDPVAYEGLEMLRGVTAPEG